MLAIPDDDRIEIERRLRSLTELYRVVKELILYFEEVNPEQKSDIQPINELRNAFDHMMRVSAAVLEIEPQDNVQLYILTNIDKAFGHVYRAGYDTIDFLSLTIKSLISEDLDGFSVEAISKALPEYYSTIKPDIEQLNQEIAKYRADKDVALKDAEHLIGYAGTVKKICTYRDQISRALPSIAEIDKKNQQEKGSAERKDWTKRIIIGIMLLIIGYFLHPLITGNTKATSQPTEPPHSKQVSPSKSLNK